MIYGGIGNIFKIKGLTTGAEKPRSSDSYAGSDGGEVGEHLDK